jgi:hypothetical protein
MLMATPLALPPVKLIDDEYGWRLSVLLGLDEFQTQASA